MLTHKASLFIGIVSVVVLVFAVLQNTLNTSFFVRILFNDAKEFSDTGTITSDFMPIGYSGFLGSCMRIGGTEGIPACQAFVYISILITTLYFFKLRGLLGYLLALGIIIISLHPMLVLNVWRVHDGNMTVLMLVGFLASGFFYVRSKSVWSTLLFGGVTGAMLTIRINTILLVLPALLLLYKKEEKTKNYIKKGLLFLAGTAIVFMGINMAVKQTSVFFPGHGFYNLFSGANEYSEKYLLKDFSGENSHKEALEAKGIFSTKSFDDLMNIPSETYKTLSLNFIKEHPAEYLKLTGIKIITFFRPGYHSPEHFRWISSEGLKRVSKIILATPFFVWVYIVWKTKKNFFEKENLFIFSVIILYFAPFFVANADPRYRFPLDIICIADGYCRIALRKTKIT